MNHISPTEESPMTIENLQKTVKSFCEAREWDQFHNPKDLAIGISTEANELLDIFRFKTDAQMKIMMKSENSREMISEELADTFFFILRFSEMYGFDLDKVLKDKMNKNNKKYPVETAKGNNLKYTEFE